ncbi:Signal recognition particle 9 kDa protein (SRP9) [Teratosphaeria destructans]|uniref:Signal recognition particle 9 kDa protein (SRP9) n=1 Tax=Teratosphaeria destructans TaxID=418781 RepID=A0A9W7SWZ0_9PEZI|nr:Signal recognition particle 9 kDa protein (SRP9) [Teratosphaeria destructans]
MVYLSTSEEWQRQSALLLRARPTTTRITTKYKLPNLNAPKYRRAAKRKRGGDVAEEQQDDSSAPKVPRATLVLKTYDHESGVVLKFKTDRAADVGRLVAGLGRLGRHMAALPEKTDGAETCSPFPLQVLTFDQRSRQPQKISRHSSKLRLVRRPPWQRTQEQSYRNRNRSRPPGIRKRRRAKNERSASASLDPTAASLRQRLRKRDMTNVPRWLSEGKWNSGNSTWFTQADAASRKLTCCAHIVGCQIAASVRQRRPRHMTHRKWSCAPPAIAGPVLSWEEEQVLPPPVARGSFNKGAVEAEGLPERLADDRLCVWTSDRPSSAVMTRLDRNEGRLSNASEVA